ncbi:hypothetical protein LC612_37525, partial [Nostoc sp. CHAB 5834]|nr:hypothetical protein [Nostoc sp. CHAB 5834]
MLKNFRAAVLLGASVMLAMSTATATDIAKVPFIGQGTEKPNVIFGMDDSGSMDFEVLLNTNDGSFWWDGDNKTGWDSKGKPLFNSLGSSSSLNKLTYLFPNGCEEYSRRLCDSTDHYAIPPTPQFAALRSAAFNPQYYNPSVTYTAWKPAAIEGSVVSFQKASGTGALSHPLFSSGAMNLTAVQLSRASGFTFEMFGGMNIPAGSEVYNASKKKWETSSARTVKAGDQERASIGYYPATYWQVESCAPNGASCVTGPTGLTLKRYEIKNGVTFPSGRSYVDELQNFANWFTYYRKRKLMLASSMGQVMEEMRGMRVGAVSFNNRSPVTMYDTDAKDDTANGRVMAGFFYGNSSSGGTPTRETLKYIGDQFNTNKGVIQYSCQKNAAFIVTDGFSGVTKITPPSYPDTYGKGSPFQTTYAGTLADIALSYYTNRLRADLAAGNVPAAAENSGPSTDKNKNLHMNTYGITLGANGTLWPGVTDAYAQTMSWPNPSTSQSPTSIDDLWHATVNGRGG